MHSRKRTRRIVMVVLLLALLALIIVLFVNYRATRQIGFDFEIDPGAVLAPPVHLFSFSGPPEDPLQRPIGIRVEGDRVYVSDSRRSVVDVFSLDGQRVAQWRHEEMRIPLYIAKNPVSEVFYVSDRRTRTIHRFSAEGEYLGQFDPELPPDQLPLIETGGVQWAPVALDFAEDGSLYVTEILKGHRLLVFDPEGNFMRSVGTAGLVDVAGDAPLLFQFPNDVKVFGEEVWVADSNNRRFQVFDLAGEFLRIFPSEGLPRGIDFLKGPSQSTEGTATLRFAVVDTLAQDVTFWAKNGTNLARVGEPGVLEGQFAYPNDLSVAANGRLYIADSANGRVQVWGWPRDEQPIPTPVTPFQWGLCLSPLLLLPLLFALRKRRFFATADFAETAFASGLAPRLPAFKRRWLMLEPELERVADLADGTVKAKELFNATEHSESDASVLVRRLEISDREAQVLSIAQRSRFFCTEDVELRRLARLLEIDVLNAEEFSERFSRKDS